MKSKKVKEILYESFIFNSGIGIDRKAAIEAVELAEQEAEERMRRKALAAFDEMWCENGENGEFEPDYEYHRRIFIKKLNEE